MIYGLMLRSRTTNVKLQHISDYADYAPTLFKHQLYTSIRKSRVEAMMQSGVIISGQNSGLEIKKRKPSKYYQLGCVQLFATPWTIARQAPLTMGFSRQEYRSGLPFPSGDLLNPEIKHRSPALQADSLLSELPGNPMLAKSLPKKGNPKSSAKLLCNPSTAPQLWGPKEKSKKLSRSLEGSLNELVTC